MYVRRDKSQKQLEVRFDEMQDDLVVVGHVSCLGKLRPGASTLWKSLFLHTPVVLA